MHHSNSRKATYLFQYASGPSKEVGGGWKRVKKFIRRGYDKTGFSGRAG